jgi:hypothetical protein
MTIETKFQTIIEYIKFDPKNNLSGNFGKAISKPYTVTGVEGILDKLKEKFVSARIPSPPTFPKTLPDEVVSLVMKEYYDKTDKENEKIKIEHQESMSAENIVGELLEKYLASVLEPLGWVWCSGDFVKAVDFIKKEDSTWKLLQVKNRSNTENSSSNKIREGTDIEKWFRINAYNGKTFWEDFPEEKAKRLLSEENFKNFVKEYIQNIKGN